MAAWVLSLLLFLQPESPWRASYEETARAIAEAAEHAEPLFPGPEGRAHTAALLVAVAYHESRFDPMAVGDGGALADAEGSSALQARRPAPDPAIAALLVLLAPTRVMEAAPSLPPAWAGLRAPLSEALREELATLDAQLAYLLGEPAPEGRAR